MGHTNSHVWANLMNYTEDKAAVGKAAEDKAAEEQKRTPVLC